MVIIAFLSKKTWIMWGFKILSEDLMGFIELVWNSCLSPDLLRGGSWSWGSWGILRVRQWAGKWSRRPTDPDGSCLRACQVRPGEVRGRWRGEVQVVSVWGFPWFGGKRGGDDGGWPVRPGDPIHSSLILFMESVCKVVWVVSVSRGMK